MAYCYNTLAITHGSHYDNILICFSIRLGWDGDSPRSYGQRCLLIGAIQTIVSNYIYNNPCPQKDKPSGPYRIFFLSLFCSSAYLGITRNCTLILHWIYPGPSYHSYFASIKYSDIERTMPLWSLGTPNPRVYCFLTARYYILLSVQGAALMAVPGCLPFYGSFCMGLSSSWFETPYLAFHPSTGLIHPLVLVSIGCYNGTISWTSPKMLLVFITLSL